MASEQLISFEIRLSNLLAYSGINFRNALGTAVKVYK